MTLGAGRRHLMLGAGVVVALLAVVETTVALVAPFRAPTDADWAAAAAAVRAGSEPAFHTKSLLARFAAAPRRQSWHADHDDLCLSGSVNLTV